MLNNLRLTKSAITKIIPMVQLSAANPRDRNVIPTNVPNMYQTMCNIALSIANARHIVKV